MNRCLTIATHAGHRLERLARRLAHGAEHVLSIVGEFMFTLCAALCAATMLVVFVGVTAIAAGKTVTTWRNTGLTVDTATAALVVLVMLGVASLVLSSVHVSRRETRHYDLQQPWLTTVEQVQADTRLRQQVGRYVEQRSRTQKATTGEHVAIGSRFP